MPIIINDEDKTKYYHSLHKAQIEKDYASLEAFFIEEQEKYYQKAKAYIICEKDFEIEM